MNPYQVVRDFEAALCEYTGAPYAVTVNSCTMALMLAVAWHIKAVRRPILCYENVDLDRIPKDQWPAPSRTLIAPCPNVEIPKRTYVSVPMSIIHAGGRPTFRDEEWVGAYQLKPFPIWDAARFFASGMYGNGVTFHASGVRVPSAAEVSGKMLCVSFHASKTLGHSQGGAILHDNAEADAWLRRARFDGRAEGVAPKDDRFEQLGYHCYMSADVAAALLVKLHSLPRHNAPLPNDDYPDLSQLEIFR